MSKVPWLHEMMEVYGGFPESKSSYFQWTVYRLHMRGKHLLEKVKLFSYTTFLFSRNC